MSVTAFQDLPLADRTREWDGDAAEKRVRKWAGAEDEPNQKYRDAHVWYDGDKKDNFTAYKLLIADVVDGKLEAVPRGVMAAGAIMDGARGGIDMPKGDVDRVKSHLAKYYKKMGDTAPWERDYPLDCGRDRGPVRAQPVGRSAHRQPANGRAGVAVRPLDGPTLPDAGRRPRRPHPYRHRVRQLDDLAAIGLTWDEPAEWQTEHPQRYDDRRDAGRTRPAVRMLLQQKGYPAGAACPARPAGCLSGHLSRPDRRRT